MITRLKTIRKQNLLADLSTEISKYFFLFLCIPDCYGSHTCTGTRTSNVTDEVRDALDSPDSTINLNSMSIITFVHTFIGAVQIYGVSCHCSSCGGHVDALSYQNTVVVIRKILKWAWNFLRVVAINCICRKSLMVYVSIDVMH